MSAFFESFLIGQAGLFSLFLAGGPLLFLYREELIDAWEWNAEQAEFKREFEEIDAEAKVALEKLNDYTFKIFLPCKSNGTGWILDYEIPEGENVYPTTWYIATNAHVANHFRFLDNDYRQELPISERNTKELRTQFNPQNFPNFPLDSTDSCYLDQYGYFDFNLSRQENGKKFRSNFGAIRDNKMEPPKLFYAPINFLNKNNWKTDNYKDFAVIQVKFRTPGYAKKATGDFYGKYGESLRKPLGIFPWEKEKTKEEEHLKDNTYSLGYGGGEGFNYSVSYDGYTPSKLARDNWFADDEGRINVANYDLTDKQITNWNGRRLHRIGHFYLLNYFAMKGGVSGGLVINGNGYILGVKSLGDKVTDKSFIVPLRSEEIDSKFFKTPKYDLILGGGKDQVSSYREQVEEYILKNNRKTWLSTRGGWSYKKR